MDGRCDRPVLIWYSVGQTAASLDSSLTLPSPCGKLRFRISSQRILDFMIRRRLSCKQTRHKTRKKKKRKTRHERRNVVSRVEYEFQSRESRTKSERRNTKKSERNDLF